MPVMIPVARVAMRGYPVPKLAPADALAVLAALERPSPWRRASTIVRNNPIPLMRRVPSPSWALFTARSIPGSIATPSGNSIVGAGRHLGFQVPAGS